MITGVLMNGGARMLLGVPLLAALTLTVRAQELAPPAAAAAKSDAGAAGGNSQGQSAGSGVGAMQGGAAAPAKKAHRVYTNEDFDALPHQHDVDGARDLLDQVNTCDRACFTGVYQRTGIPASSNVQWKQMLVDDLDKVRADLTWQGLLREGIAIQVRSCELELQKRQDLARFSDPRTVTHSELVVERQYEPKFREQTQRLADLDKRAADYIRKYAEEPYRAAFMHLQLERIGRAECRITVQQPENEARDRDDGSPD